MPGLLRTSGVGGIFIFHFERFRVLKTRSEIGSGKLRRIYDITNILASLGLLAKVRSSLIS